MIISLNERLRRLTDGSRLLEDDYESIWIEELHAGKRKARRLGTVADAERFLAKRERAARLRPLG